MANFLQFLTQSNPLSGRWIKEDGDTFNAADAWALADEYSVLTETILNGATLLSKRVEVTTENYYFGFIVPMGREFVLFDRQLTLGEGAYEIDTLTVPDGFTGGTAALKTTLKAGAVSSVTTDLFCGVTPTNIGTATLRDEDFIDNGVGIGSGRASGGAQRDGVLRIFGAGSTGLLRVRRRQAANYTATIRIFCWEKTP